MGEGRERGGGGIMKEGTLHHHAPVGQGRSGPGWLAIAVGLLSGRVVRYSHCVGRVLIHSSLYGDLWGVQRRHRAVK